MSLWRCERGPYFYMESAQTALLFPPEMGHYWQVLKTIFAQAASLNGHAGPRSPQQRREEGVPLIGATIARWRLFQQLRPSPETSLDPTQEKNPIATCPPCPLLLQGCKNL